MKYTLRKDSVKGVHIKSVRPSLPQIFSIQWVNKKNKSFICKGKQLIKSFVVIWDHLPTMLPQLFVFFKRIIPTLPSCFANVLSSWSKWSGSIDLCISSQCVKYDRLQKQEIFGIQCSKINYKSQRDLDGGKNIEKTCKLSRRPVKLWRVGWVRECGMWGGLGICNLTSWSLSLKHIQSIGRMSAGPSEFWQ